MAWRFARRAALRGTLALGVTSAAGALASTLCRCALPVRAAGTAAFVTGAAQELPALALPLAGAALWQARRAVPSGHRWRERVAAGAVVGAGLGVATRRLWPLAPHRVGEVALTRLELTPSPRGEGLGIVVNETAGPALSGRPAKEVRRELPEAHLIEVDEGTDLAAALEQVAASPVAIGVAGGDGSINAAAAVAAERGKPLMAVPAGTLNHLARDLGLLSLADSVRAVRRGQAVAVDLATIDGRVFLNTASFGSYVDLVDARERLESVIGKWPAVGVALWRVLRRADPVEVELDGRRRRLWMVFVGNCRYQPSGFTPSWRPRLDDGQLDVRVVDAVRPWSRLRLCLAVATGTLGRCGVYEQWTATRLDVRSLQGALRLARDGETFDGREEFSVVKEGEHLAVYVPW